MVSDHAPAFETGPFSHVDNYLPDREHPCRSVPVCPAQGNDFTDPAHEADGRACDTRRAEINGISGFQVGRDKIINVGRRLRSIHLFCKCARDKVPSEFTGQLGIERGVLGIGTREAYEWQRVGKRIEEPVWHEGATSSRGERSDSTDRAWPDKCIERMVRKPVALCWAVEVRSRALSQLSIGITGWYFPDRNCPKSRRTC